MKIRCFEWAKKDIGKYDGSEKLIDEFSGDIITQIGSLVFICNTGYRVVDISYSYDSSKTNPEEIEVTVDIMIVAEDFD